MKYRPEIDGLRALAVIPVILFHAGFNLFNGGYVGVDVFFVISGYLITTILIEDLENNRFSLISFYERRARRILPALYFVMFICIPFSWLWMTPTQWKVFSQSLGAVTLFVSNILFWRESGYFKSNAEELPLLHTWSLSVEEQYYLLFPIFLFLLWRFGKNKVFLTIVIISIVSLVLSEFGWRYKETANFYLTPTRAWELLFGSMTAFIIKKQGVKKNNLLSLIGVSAIFFSIFFYDKSTPFPSIYTLVPVIGVVLFILYADKDTYVAKLFSLKLLVGIGLISYSAYLWHQPILALSRIKIFFDEPSKILMFSLSISSIVLAFFSWKFIEKPFRTQGTISRSSIFRYSLIGGFVFISVAVLGQFEKILAFSEIKNKKLIEDIEFGSYGGGNIDRVDLVKNPKIILVGDSHARQYIIALREILPKTSIHSFDACLSLPGLINEYRGKTSSRTGCINHHKEYIDYIKNNNSINTIIIAQSWPKNLFDLSTRKILGYVDKSSESKIRFEKELSELFFIFQKLKLNVIVVGHVPSARAASKYMKNGFVECIYAFGEDLCDKEYSKEKRAGIMINNSLKKVSKSFNNVTFLDPFEALCDNINCFIIKNKNLIYSDHAHLTKYGADLIADKLKKYIGE
tara:strand:+ start:3334 stop:5229 length:1896 start_codon:yes stop_codon:yes gene_type:complete